MLGFVALTVLAVCGLLAALARESRAGVWVAKPLASAGFIAAALAAGALDSAYGLWVLAALTLCACGDVLLIPRARPLLFQAGMASFGLGHLAFAAAFWLQGFDPRVGLPLALGTGLAGLWALRWLRPHIPTGMRVPVRAYIVVISLMLVCAASAVSAVGDTRVLLGAALFYASDLAVARDRFIAPAFVNRAWGLPLYYAGQLLLASTVS